jgi:hypothetical protein
MFYYSQEFLNVIVEGLAQELASEFILLQHISAINDQSIKFKLIFSRFYQLLDKLDSIIKLDF